MKIAALVGLGSFIGGLLRYLTTAYFVRISATAFPWGTFIVNITGCLLIGIFFGLSERFSWMNTEWRIFLTTGLCGGFTTFSAFAYENIRLLQTSNYSMFVLYSAGSFIACLLATFGGISLSKI